MPTGQTQHHKKRLFLLRAGRNCPLTSTESRGFNAIAVYSFLVYRLKVANGDQNKAAVSNKQIQRGTGLCRSRTIPAAIRLLEEHGLLGRHDGRVFAHQGKAASWFVEMKNSQHKPWYARFAYFKIWIPSTKVNRLTARQNALFWLVAAKPRQRQVYYALCLGIDAKTVRRAVKRLRDMGLVSRTQLEPLELADCHYDLWQDQAERKPKKHDFRLSRVGLFTKITAESPFEFFAIDGESGYQAFCQKLDEHGHRMQGAGYSTVEIGQFWDETAEGILLATGSMLPLELFVFEFRKMFGYVEAITLKHRVAGSFNGANSLGLLKRVTNQACHQLRAAWQNSQTYGSTCFWSWSSE